MADGELVVATYNVHGCVGVDGRFRPDRIAEVIREIGADVVGLQEVDRRVRRGRPTLELEMLAGGSGLACFAGPTIVDPDGDYGNGLLSRYPVRALRHLDLTVGRREPRGAIDADLDVEGDLVRVVVTHLGLGIPERRDQVSRLLASIGESDDPVVLLGDVNEWHPFSRSLRLLEARLGPSARGRTFPSVLPLLALDRIWASPRRAIVEARVHATPLARVASDHLPLVARIRYRDFGGTIQR
ncbi:MAG TPA: endonuclease/exonuclease/phosphatase family protein [Thermodesulfobacteriota bacterium]